MVGFGLVKMTLPILLLTIFTLTSLQASSEKVLKDLNFFFGLTSLGFYSAVLFSPEKWKPIETLIQVEVLAIITNLCWKISGLVLLKQLKIGRT